MTASGRALPRAADAAARAAIRDFQSDTAELIAAPVPLRTRITLHAVALMVATFIALAAVVPIDRVVKARGRVVSEAPTIVVQPMDLATVRAIHVREGQLVRKGDLLASLDSTFSGADYARIAAERAALTQEVARLQAEFGGSDYRAPAGDDWGTVQAALFAARRAGHEAALARYDEKIAATLQLIDRAEKDLAVYRERLDLFTEVEGMRTTLEERKVGSRLSSLVATDSRLEMGRNVSTTEGAIAASRHELAALRAERQVYVKGRQAEIARDLADRRGALDRAREEVAKAERRRDLVELRAVADAVVLQVGSFSVGSVVQPAERLFTLMPADTRLEIDAEIAAADQGNVKVGDEVVLKLDAWPFVEHGAARGVVRTISGDSFTPKDGNGRTVFLAKIDIDRVELRGVPDDFRLVPGMPLTADIAVGTHTLLAYLTDGALKTVDEGLSEP